MKGLLGWVLDTFRVLFGLDERSRIYRDNLANAERYLHWGSQSRDGRDYKRALEWAAQCADEASPGPRWNYRKLRVAVTANLELSRLAVVSLEALSRKLNEHYLTLREGRKGLVSQVDNTRRRVAQLEAEGSLISAREERRRLQEMEHEVRELPDIASEERLRRAEVLGRTRSHFQRHREEAGRQLAALRGLADLAVADRSARDGAVAEFERALADLDARWQAMLAEFPASPPPGPPSPPAAQDPAAP